MKRHSLILSAVVFALLATFTAPAASAQAASWQQIPIPPLPAFHPQQPKRIELPNGMVIFLQEDHELPLIDGVARIRGGSRSVPAAKTGLMDIYGEVWRTGGTKTQTGDALDDFLEVRAAKVETDANADSTTISLSCLKGDFDDVFKAFNDLLREPAFRDDKIDIAKKGMYDAISRRNDSPEEIASRISHQLVYGNDNPYARVPEYATIDAITKQDLSDWHDSHVYPNDIILGLVGDFDSTAMEAKLRAVFASWPKGPDFKAPDIQFDPPKPGYYLATKTDINQSSIRMVELGTKRDNPDFYAIEVFNEAFGGGFSSRLFKNIRTAKGLAYEVGGGIGTSFDHPGISRIVEGTKSASTIESIEAIYQQIDELKTHPITEDEIKLAKDSILNSFVFNFDTPGKVLRERMAYEFYGYPPDFLERYRAGIEKVTAADVARIVPKYLHKDQLRVLVVGNPAGFDKPLSTLGQVTDVDLTIPPPPGENQQEESKPTASNPEGKALAAKAVAAIGGEEKLKSVKALRSEYSMDRQTPQGEMQMTMQATLVFPDHLHVSGQGPMGNFTLVATPDVAFISFAGMGVRDMPAPQKEDTLRQIKRDLAYVGQHLNDPAFSFEAAGSGKIGDTVGQIVNINGPGVSLRWFVDPQSGHVLGESYESMGPGGPEKAETQFADWKTADGLTLPYKRINTVNGEPSSTSQFTSIEINPVVDSKLFDKPAMDAQNTH
jgi:zinc protease